MNTEIIIKGIHLFTDRTDLALKSWYGGRKRTITTWTEILKNDAQTLREMGQEVSDEEYLNSSYHQKIIGRGLFVEYPHAASYFFDFVPSFWGHAEAYSRRRKEPLLFGVVLTDAPPAFKMVWADKGECVTEWARGIRTDYGGLKRPEDFSTFPETYGHLFATNPAAITPSDDELPLEYIARLERELGIFIGSTPLEDFLATCTKVKETEFATVYKSNRLG